MTEDMTEDRRVVDDNINKLRQEVRNLTILLSANTKITSDLAKNVAGLVSAWEAGKWFVQFAKFGAIIVVAASAFLTWWHSIGNGK